MIFKQETQILKCTFEKEHFSKVKAAFKDRWPVVYIIEDDEKGQAYIGESQIYVPGFVIIGIIPNAEL